MKNYRELAMEEMVKSLQNIRQNTIEIERMNEEIEAELAAMDVEQEVLEGRIIDTNEVIEQTSNDLDALLLSLE